MRHIAGKVLALWLVSWILAVMQPCCEAIASSVPHEHPHSQPQDLHTSHHANDADTVPEHRHCKPEIPDVSDLSAPVTDKLSAILSKPTFEEAADYEISPSVIAPLSPVSILFTLHDPPCSFKQVYLLTLRLRI